MRTWDRLAALSAVLMLGLAACGGDDDDGGGSGSDDTESLGGEPLSAIGDGEGQLSVLAGRTTAEDGTFNDRSTGSRRSKRTPGATPR